MVSKNDHIENEALVKKAKSLEKDNDSCKKRIHEMGDDDNSLRKHGLKSKTSYANQKEMRHQSAESADKEGNPFSIECAVSFVVEILTQNLQKLDQFMPGSLENESCCSKDVSPNDSHYLCIGTQSMEQLRYGCILSWRISSKCENALDFGSRWLRLQILTCVCPRMLSKPDIIRCDRIKINANEVFTRNGSHEILLKQSLPQVRLQGQSHDIGTIEHLFLDLPDRFGTSIEILFGSLVIQQKQIPVNDSTSQKLSLVCNLLLLLFPAQALHLVGYCSVVARRCVHPLNPVLLLVVDGTNITLFFLLPCYILLLVNLLNFEEMKSRCVPRQGELTVIIVDWLFKRHLALLLHLPFAQVYGGVSLFYKEEDKLVAVTLYGDSKVAAVLLTKDDLALLLHGTGHFVGQEHVDDSDRLCTFIFGSLTRPPEAHCVCFKPLPYFIGFGLRGVY